MCKVVISVLVAAVFTLSACETRPGKVDIAGTDSTANISADSINAGKEITEDISAEEYATYYIVAADTSIDYYMLREKMFKLSGQLKLPIDTMGRYMNENKKLIALPDDDEDEMYAGEYFPRRFPSENLSLEYLSFYSENAGEKMIALVSGIFESEQSADSALAVLKNADAKSFKVKANVHIGCMH